MCKKIVCFLSLSIIVSFELRSAENSVKERSLVSVYKKQKGKAPAGDVSIPKQLEAFSTEDAFHDDIWFRREGSELVPYELVAPYNASKRAEVGHPNSKGKLNEKIKSVIKDPKGPGSLTLRELHQLVYDKVFQENSRNIDYTFLYGTNIERVYSLNFLHSLVVDYQPPLLSLVLKKCTPDLTVVLDSQGNNILHVAAYFRFPAIVSKIIKYSKDKKFLNVLINARNKDGTNPLGMLFLNTQMLVGDRFYETAKLIVMEPSFEINRYLNNKRGMDVFAPKDLSEIGGLNYLHVILILLKKDEDQLQQHKRCLELLFDRSSELQEFRDSSEAVNFSYPAMNPKYHMFHPEKLAEKEDTGIDFASIRKIYEGGDSGDSDDETKSSWHYKQGLRALSDFIQNNQGERTVGETTSTTTPQPKVDATLLGLLNSPATTPLSPDAKEQVRKDKARIAVVHFHGVPFMKGQLTNHERRTVGKRFIKINEEYMGKGLKNIPENEKLKAVYTRTTTASLGIENHKMLIDASDKKLFGLTRINKLLRELLARFYKEKSEELRQEIENETKNSRSIRALKIHYGIKDTDTVKFGTMFETLFRGIKTDEIESVFLFVVQKYVNSFTSDSLMPFFWKTLEMGLGPIDKDVVQYRFPFASTSKSPDHAFKYGMGYNVEEELRREESVSPQYDKGRPKHRLAGFLYLVMSDLNSYLTMADKGQIIDTVEYNKSGQLKLDPHIGHQSETIFLGGIDGKDVSLIVPLVYLNFRKENKELYTEIFNLSSEDWTLGEKLNGSIKQKTSGGNHTKEFKLLLKIYLPFAIKLAKAVAHAQGKILHFIDACRKLQVYEEGTQDQQATFSTEVQVLIRSQVSSQSTEGKNKVPKTENIYHILEHNNENEDTAKQLSFNKPDIENIEEY